jgi:hypothetical protein
MAGFQQYLRNQNMFSIWNLKADKLEPFLSKNNLHPPARPIENSVFHELGRGNWNSCTEGVIEALQWREEPWELACPMISPETESDDKQAKSVKIFTNDPLDNNADIECISSTDLNNLESSSFDLVITDPPFGSIMQYGELSGFFFSWMAPQLKDHYTAFSMASPPTALEAVENSHRHGKDSNAFYQRILTNCWSEANRILRRGGILAFTFHHDKDGPWVAVLRSLFDAGFYLEATYPIRSDETKGEGSTPGTFGAQKVEFDIIHVCRKRLDEPTRVSWAKMRREVLQDVRQLQQILEHHREDGLPAADLQVIRRGKALEYFSRHYGQVYVNDERPITVEEALVGINQLIDEEAGAGKEPPPANAEPLTRQFLRIFDGKAEEKRDQLQKYLRGTGVTPDEYIDLGWCEEADKVFRPISPLKYAHAWHGRHRRNLVRDYDQAMVLTGACFENSGINAADTVKNDNFTPRPSLKALLDWFARRGNAPPIRAAAARALAIYQGWEKANEAKARQLSLFDEA